MTRASELASAPVRGEPRGSVSSSSWLDGAPHFWRDFAFLFFCALGVLWPALGTGLLADDWGYRALGESASSIGALFGTVEAQARPLGTAVLALLLGKLQLSAEVLSAMRLLHHALNATLVLWVAARLLGLSGRYARAAALAFLLWASHGELFWHSSLFDVLATTFVLQAVLLAARRPSVLGGAGLFLCALAAYWTKESAWTLPAILGALAMLRGSEDIALASFGRTQRGVPSQVWPVVIALAALGVVLVVRVIVAGGLWIHVGAAFREGLSLQTLASSLTKLLFRSLVPGWIDAQGLVAVLKPIAVLGIGVAGVAVVALLAWPRARAAVARHWRGPGVVLAVAFALTLAPVATLSVSLLDTDNVRYLTLPTVFIALGFGVILGRAAARTPGMRALRGGLMVLLLFQGFSLHATSYNWATASAELARYEAALRPLVRAHPDAHLFFLGCVPDNVRGAFVARNATRELLHRANPSRDYAVRELAWLSIGSPGRVPYCEIRGGGDAFELTVAPPAALTHPDFHRPRNPTEVPPFVVGADGARSTTIRLSLSGALPAGSATAFYDGTAFRPLPAPSGGAVPLR